MMNKIVEFEDLGLIEYKKCWDYQERILVSQLDLHQLPGTVIQLVGMGMMI